MTGTDVSYRLLTVRCVYLLNLYLWGPIMAVECFCEDIFELILGPFVLPEFQSYWVNPKAVNIL